MNADGELGQLPDGRWQLRFRRVLPHPPERVWRAVTEPEQLAQWFPSTIEGERAAGAALRFTFPGAVGEPIEGRMLAYEPPELIELRWGTDILRLELRALEGGTELILLDTLEERGKAARDGAGWHTCLEALEGVLAGHAEPRAALARERWAEVHPQYVRRFGPEAATIGPPSDE